MVERLRERIEENQLDPFTVYDSYDKHHDQHLKLDEFSKLLAKIDPKLSESEIGLCFEKFDINGDGSITFDEFYRTICKIAGTPYQASGGPHAAKEL